MRDRELILPPLFLKISTISHVFLLHNLQHILEVAGHISHGPVPDA